MKVFTDPITGKKFQLGTRGSDALLERVKDYVAGRKEEGVSEVSLAPSKMEAGSQFECSACEQVFTFDGDDYDEFIESIKTHGQAHGQCSITPII